MNKATPCTTESIIAALAEQPMPTACIVKDSSDDISSVFLTELSTLKNAGTAARIVCLDDVAARTYLNRLGDFPDVTPDDIITIDALSLRTLEDPAILEHAGRGPYVLHDNDMDVLVEDLKTTGIKPRRLREMAKFFFKSFSEFADEEPRFIMEPDEQQLLDTLTRNLKARNAVLEYEVAAMAYRGAEATGFEAVDDVLLADDYGMFSLAQQRLVNRLAKQGLVVAGNDCGPVCDSAPYPHREGLNDFIGDHADALYFASEPGTAAPAVSQQGFTTPADEFAGIADAVRADLDAGRDARDILICVPNDTWGGKVAEQLRERDIAVRRLPSSGKIKGDPRKPERLGNLKTATFLRLLDDPDDIVALRTWMGLGDWLLCSDAFFDLMDYADEHDCSPFQALRDIRSSGKTPFALFTKLAVRLDELDEIRAAYVEGADNTALFAAHGMAPVPAETPDVGSDAVTVAPYRQCHGRHAPHSYIAGCIDGFLPAHDAVDDRFTIDHRNKAMDRERLLFDDLCSTGRDTLTQTYFTEDLLDNTGILKMESTRVFIKDNVRMAKVKTSQFLTDRERKGSSDDR